MKLNPIGDKVVVRRLRGESTSKGGILLSDPEKPDMADVVAAGPGGADGPLGVKAGDRVILGKHQGTTVKVEGEELLVVREKEIFAIVES